VPSETETPTRSYLTVGEFAESRRIHPMTVYRLVANGEIPAERIGHSIRIIEDVPAPAR